MSTKRNIKLLAIFNFLLDFNLFAPVAIIYFAKVVGSYALGMSIFSIYMISAALFEVPTGIVSDKVGRKRTIILGSIASFLSTLILAISASYFYLAVSALFVGLARAFFSGNNDAFLYDTLKDSNKEKEYHIYLGKVSSLFQVALAISAAIGSILASISFSVLLWLSVLPKLVMLVVSLAFVEPKSYVKAESNIFSHTKEALRYFWKNRRLRSLSLASILGFSLGEASFQFQAVFINTLWPLWAVGISKMLSNIGAFFSYYFSGKLIKRFKEKHLLIIGGLYGRAANFVALIFPSVVSPAIISSCSVFFGVTQVARNHLMQREFSDTQRATMSSLNALAGSIVFAVVAYGLGMVADNIGPAKALLIVQLLLMPVVFIYWRLFRTKTL